MTTTDSDTAIPRDRGMLRALTTFARELGIDPQDPHLLQLAEHQRFVEDHAPKVIPPCPPCCVLPARHDYDGTDGTGEDLTFERTHVALETEHLSVNAKETNRHGIFEVRVPTLWVERDDTLNAAQARAFAAELLSAADLLDTITG